MGNSSTKEQRLPPPPGFGQGPSSQTPRAAPAPSRAEDRSNIIYGTRPARSSRSELSTIFGLGNASDRDAAGLESRRETKAEREARKLEKERANRERERERSMSEEGVDGGYLVTQGVYTGSEDYNKAVVRQLMVDRRIAPFWRGLNDHSESWTEHQLVAAARGLPVPAADAIPPDPRQRPSRGETGGDGDSADRLTVPVASGAPSYASDASGNFVPGSMNSSLPSQSSISSSALLRGRAKTLASLTTSSKHVPHAELTPREVQLPKDPFVNGQSIEACLYKDASECPICFLYYPPYLNRTRCCDQPICSECFVQIKRPDPHPPEHADPSALPPSPCDDGRVGSEVTLVSEPAQCPYCARSEFGVTFDPPPFRRGIAYVNQPARQLPNGSLATSSSTSLASVPTSGQLSPTTRGRRRAVSLPPNAPTVVTTDFVRPDWATKLATARAHAARRAAAATALHTAAYLMGGRNGPSDARGFGGFGRRGMLRRGNGSEGLPGGAGSNPLDVLAVLSERYGGALEQARNGGAGGPSIAGPPRQSSRRNRIDDIEEMMMMEAIRLSLASEEERRKKEEKEGKKEAKKKAKDDKKADKAVRKNGMYLQGAGQSSGTLGSPSSDTFSIESGKGKAIARTGGSQSSEPGQAQPGRSIPPDPSKDGPQTHPERSRGHMPLGEGGSSPFAPSAYRPSHLRNLSNASSSTSSMADLGGPTLFGQSSNGSGIQITRAEMQENTVSATPPGGGAGLEPVFNFRSLAAVIGDEQRQQQSGHFEDVECASLPGLSETGESSRHDSGANAEDGYPVHEILASGRPGADGNGIEALSTASVDGHEDMKHHEVQVLDGHHVGELGGV